MIFDLSKTSYVIILIFTGLLISPVGYQGMNSVENGTNVLALSTEGSIPQRHRLLLDQELESPENLLNNIIPTLQDIKNETGSWSLPSIANDDVYFGLYGGLAGVGMELINLHKLSEGGLTQANRDLALVLAIEIGYHMDSLSASNASGKFWPITEGSNLTDFGYHYGLSGIASFFAHLFNASQIQDFADISRETVSAIDSSVNKTGGLHWSSQIIREAAFSQFYPNRELRYYTVDSYTAEDTYFSGLGLGTLGVTQGMIDVINMLGTILPSDIEYGLLNSSLEWMENHNIEDIEDLSFSMTEPDIGIYSTSKANGVSGMIDVYLQLHQLTGNASYLTSAEKGINWLNQSVIGVPRYQVTTQINDTLSFSITLGLSHGVAGTLDTFHRFNQYADTVDLDNVVQTLLFYLHNFGVETDSEYRYPERFSSGVTDNLGSLSYQTGGGGILSLVDEISDFLGLDQLNGDITKGKTYLYNSVINHEGLSIVPFLQTGNAEILPSSGFLSSYHLILVSVIGQLSIASQELNFGVREVDSSLSISLPLQNTGDETILAQWDISDSTVFRFTNFSTNISPRSTYSLFISFIPLEEGTFAEILTITDENGNDYLIDILGQSFNLPILETVTVLENNTVIQERIDTTFVVSATDSSGIESVKIDINGEVSSMTTEVNSDEYTYLWNLGTIQNGTFLVTFNALDSVGFTSSLTFVYTVSIYDVPLDEKVFSDTNLVILIGLVVVVIGVAIVVTRRIQN